MPWIGCFYKMAVADKFVYLDNVPYSKGSYTNRVQIKTQGGPRWLTVPASTSGKLGQGIVELAAILKSGQETSPPLLVEHQLKVA